MGPPRTDPKQRKKKKEPRTDEERVAGRQLYLQRLKDKVHKKESQQLKFMNKVAKKAKDLEIRKLKRRLAIIAKIESGEIVPEAEEAKEADSDADEAEEKDGKAEKKAFKYEKGDKESLEKQLAAAKRLNHQSIAILVSKKMEFETTKDQEPEVDNDPPKVGPDPAIGLVTERVLKAKNIARQMEESKGVIADAKKLIERFEVRKAKSAARHERRKAKAERIAQGLEPPEPEVKPEDNNKKKKGKEPRKPKKKDKNSWSMKKRMLMGKLLMGKAKYSKEGRMEAKRLAQEMLSHQGYQPPSGPPQQGRRPPQGGRNQQGGRAQEGSSQHQKPEELHPSWAAKKRQSGMLGDIPTQGKAKKVVFED